MITAIPTTMRIKAAGAASLLGLGLALTAITPAPAAEEMSRAEVESIIREYLLANPKLVIDAIEQHQLNEELARVEAVKTKLEEYRDELENAPEDPSYGDPDAAVTVVEFFDYECGFCKRAFPDLMALPAHDSDVRVVFKEFPILAETSENAAKAALAAQRQGKFIEFHSALMTYQGRKTESLLRQTAEELGLDLDRWEADRNSPEVAAQIARNKELGMELQLGGTPAFIIGEEIIPGAIGLEQMKRYVDQARGEG